MPKFKENTSPAMKRSGFKMKGYSYPGTSPVRQETTQEERDAMTPAERLLAVVPDKAAYDALPTDEERTAFDIAAKKAGLPIKEVSA